MTVQLPQLPDKGAEVGYWVEKADGHMMGKLSAVTAARLFESLREGKAGLQ